MVAAEKGLKRLWEAYEILKKMSVRTARIAKDKELDEKINNLIDELEDFMNDDFNTAKVLANIFEIVPVINSIKDGLIEVDAISSSTLQPHERIVSTFISTDSGLEDSSENNEPLNGVMELLIDIRKEAKSKKDFLLQIK